MNSSISSSESRGPFDGPPGENRAYLGWWAATTLIGVVLIGVVNWLVDPLQFYRKAVHTPVWSENQRYQIPGLVKHYDYETIVVGTSHAENFLPSEIELRLGERAVNLAISGSSALEQRWVVEKAIMTGKVRHVLWVLDRIAFRKPPNTLGRPGEDFPLHLYREDSTTPILYLLSADTLAQTLLTWLGQGHRDLDTLNTWYADYEFGRGPVLRDWRRRLAVLALMRSVPGYRYHARRASTRRSIARNLAATIRAHPDVRFDLIFPPYSMLSYLADLANDPRAYAARQRYKADVVTATAGRANVRVFDFQGIESISLDFDHFKDLEHFELKVNALILDAIAEGRQRVVKDGYEAQLARQAAGVERFRASVCAPGSPRRALCPGVRPGGSRP